MDDTHRAGDDQTEDDDAEELAALQATDAADAPDAAERLADRLQAMLDESEEPPS
jgi:hypothetical protein